MLQIWSQNVAILAMKLKYHVTGWLQLNSQWLVSFVFMRTETVFL